MRAILIDDEKPALLHLERLLLADGRIEVAGRFTSAQAGLDFLASVEVDVVFLDIGMPEMNGLEAARRIREMNQWIRIVHITAYSDYAIEAFEHQALDYLLKPIVPVRFAKTLDRLERELSSGSQSGLSPAGRQTENNRDMILSFKRLEWRGRAEGSHTIKWRTAKAQELFAYLVYQMDKWISKDQLLELLWPEIPLDKAVTALHNSVSQIRKFLKESGLKAGLEYALDSYRLSSEELDSDIRRFETASIGPITDERARKQAEGLLELYRGHYLEDYDYFWAVAVRSKLTAQYTQMVYQLVRFEREAGRLDSALLRLRRLQEMEPYSEEVCRAVMVAYVQQGDYEGMRKHYDMFTRLLHKELGVKPEPSTITCYHELVNGDLSRIEKPLS